MHAQADTETVNRISMQATEDGFDHHNKFCSKLMTCMKIFSKLHPAPCTFTYKAQKCLLPLYVLG